LKEATVSADWKVEIEVSLLPPSDEKEYRTLHVALVGAMSLFPELGVRGEEDMGTFFRPDLMQYGLGEEIFVKIIVDQGGVSPLTPYDEIREATKTVIGNLYPEAKTIVVKVVFQEVVSRSMD